MMKNTIKILALLLAAITALSSCGAPKETEKESETIAQTQEGTESEFETESETEIQEETEKETEAVVTEKYVERTTDMKAGEGTVKFLGRTYLSGNALICDHAASGIEVVIDCQGDVAVAAEANNANTVFTVVVDDEVTKNVIFDKGNRTYTIAKGLTKGTHVIRLVNEAGYSGPCKLLSLTYTGKLIKMADNERYIEFVGDSISAGYGLGGTAEELHDATLAYPYLTAEKLGADYSICARSGLGVAYSAGASNIFENYYPFASVERGKMAYDPVRTPDLVVTNLHTNDNYQWYSKGGNVEGDYYNYATFDAKFDNIIKTVTKAYSKEIPMLFVFGCMANSKWTLATDRSVELIQTKYLPDGYNIKVVTLPTSRDGKEAHPSVKGAALQAEELVRFIEENYYN